MPLRGRLARPQQPPSPPRTSAPWTPLAALEHHELARGAGERILIVDADAQGIALATYHLVAAGYRVSTTLRGVEAITSVARERPDFVLLSAWLPDISGLEILRRLRLPGPHGIAGAPSAAVPVLLLLGGSGTPAAREAERLNALALGADDVLDRPLVIRELLLRMASILRRAPAAPAARTALFEFGSLRIDVPGREVTVGGAVVELTRTEFGLLQTLAEHAGHLRTRAQLSEALWGQMAVGRPRNRAVSVQVYRLRQKLGPAAAMVETVPREGYRFRRPRPAPSEHADGAAGR